MEEQPRLINCYTCGKENLGIFFCNDECHQKWKDAHPVPRKNQMDVSEIQERIRGWIRDPHRWRPVFADKKADELEHKELKDLFT